MKTKSHKCFTWSYGLFNGFLTYLFIIFVVFFIFLFIVFVVFFIFAWKLEYRTLFDDTFRTLFVVFIAQWASIVFLYKRKKLAKSRMFVVGVFLILSAGIFHFLGELVANNSCEFKVQGIVKMKEHASAVLQNSCIFRSDDYSFIVFLFDSFVRIIMYLNTYGIAVLGSAFIISSMKVCWQND